MSTKKETSGQVFDFIHRYKRTGHKVHLIPLRPCDYYTERTEEPLSDLTIISWLAFPSVLLSQLNSWASFLALLCPKYRELKKAPNCEKWATMLTCGSFLPFCFPASTARALLAGAMAAIQPVLCRLSNGQQCQNLQSANLQALLCLPGSSYWWVPGVSAPSWSRPTCSTVTRPGPVLDNLLSHWLHNQLLVVTMACRKYVPAHVCNAMAIPSGTSLASS